ncbi:MAG TPA: hypothetical protein VH912_13535 [Streptosporangiaceae bacterium]|jgi:hypothetical protein
MTPGTLVLLHSPLTTAAAWGRVPGTLRTYGLNVVAPEITDDDRQPYAGRYVAGAALAIGAARPEPPLVLVGQGDAGPLLPPIGAAQRAAHRLVGAYVFCDATLPGPAAASRLDQIAADDPAYAAELRRRLDRGERVAPRTGGDAVPRGADYFTEELPMPQDWPDAPCGYLRTASGGGERQARQAALRGWPVREHGDDAPDGLAAALRALIAEL